MILFKLKNMVNEDTTTEQTYNQVRNYQLDAPTLFQYNAFNVINNFTVFQDVKGKTAKIVAGYHQYFAVRKAVERMRKAIANHNRKVGVVWHTN